MAGSPARGNHNARAPRLGGIARSVRDPGAEYQREATADMANIPKKVKDPAETALTAIQEALKGPDASAGRGGAGADMASGSADGSRRMARGAASASDNSLFDDAAPGADDQSMTRRAANDDRQSIGQILQTLQRRPPKTSFLVATLFAVAWVIGGFIVACTLSSRPAIRRGPGRRRAPALIGLAALVLAPVAFFFVLAHMVWRSRELRLIAQSMAERRHAARASRKRSPANRS